jgi:two-component system CheB/CheR fusion protein
MSAETEIHPLHIFVVENHPDTLKWIQFYLEDFGHQVSNAQTVTEALAEFPKSHCDVLISDIGLPDGNGWDLLKQLDPPPRFAIAMSGFGMNADSSRSRAAGFRHHLLKPFKSSELDRMLAEATRELAPSAP